MLVIARPEDSMRLERVSGGQIFEQRHIRLGFLLLGTLQTHYQRNVQFQFSSGANDALRDNIATHNPAKDVDLILGVSD